MLKVKCFIFFVLCIVSLKATGQVNLQTGSANFSVPMFNWQDDKSRLNAIVALSYNSGNGLKVGEVASNVGQGWNLVAGGSITRIQVGLPDDQVVRNGNGTDYDITKYPPGVLFGTVPVANGIPDAIRKYPLYKWKNQLYTQHNVVAEDKELDYFSFQFNGKAGMFVLDPANIGVAQSLGDTKMIITFQQDAGLISQGIRTAITSFTIRDVDGLIYKFARHGLTKVLESAFCDASLNQKQTQPRFREAEVYHQAGFDNPAIVNPWVIGNWFLTEIQDGLTGRKVLFNYTTRNINTTAGEDLMYYSIKGYSIIAHKRSITQSPVLTSITFPDGHTSTLNYGADRIDMAGDKVLSSVDFAYQGRSLSKYVLNTSYFILNRYGTPVTDYQKKAARLCLRSVQKYGVDLKEDSPPYIFDYYLGSNTSDDFVPPPFFYAKDIWGFYNGNNSVGFLNEPIALTSSVSQLNNSQIRGLCFARNGQSAIVLNPKTNYAKNGLLRQVIYPTGGTLSYSYAQNSGVLNGTLKEVGGVHVTQTSSTDGGYANNCANPLTTLYNYKLEDGSSSLWGLEMPVNTVSTQNHYQPEERKYRMTFSTFPFGECKWKYQYPGILNMQQAISLTGWQKAMETIGPVLGIIGAVSTIVDVINLIASFSSATLVGVIIDVIVGLVTLGLTCLGDNSKDTYNTTFYNSDLNGAAPLPTQFKRVEVVENPGTIGKTIQEFTSADDYPVWEPTNPFFAARQRFAPWAYGLPKRTIILDANANKVKETENIYNFSFAKSIVSPCYNTHGAYYCDGVGNGPSAFPSKVLSCKSMVVKSTSQKNAEWSDPNVYNTSYRTASNSELKVDFYLMYTGRVQLDTVHERDFKQNDPSQFLTRTTSYDYNVFGNYEPNTISITESDGSQRHRRIRYTTDYPSGVINTMLQNNMVSVPVSVQNIVANTSVGWASTSEEVTEFSLLSNGDIKPYRTLEQRFSSPQNSFSSYLGPGSNIANYKITQQFSYDASGNLVGVKDEGGRTIASLYGYNDKYVVASIINADPAVDKYAYASFESGSEMQGWAYSGTVGSSSFASVSVTGKRSFQLTPNYTFTAPVNASKPNTVSFWAANASVQVTATGGMATQTKAAPTINGYTYFEYELSQGTTSVGVGNASTTIDELRLYPKTARMRTVSYDPAIGKTAECDENNRITYYEYDNMGRLQFIRDEKKNVVKMYEYNNISPAKQNGCPGIYYNKLVSETFTKNNCGAGYLGGTVTYTVAANTYSSALSQQDADMKAENYLLANGQTYANTNGNCILLYYNVQRSQTFEKENCPDFYVGVPYTYTVPAGRYSSAVSQAEANALADAEIAANGQAAANSTTTCNIDTNPIYDWLSGSPYYCKLVNGVWHLFVKMTNVNPNSSTYNETRWADVGQSDLCQSGGYYNEEKSQAFTRNNCAPGYTGSLVTYTVSANTYASPVSVAAANQLALDDIAANGQAYANANGTCPPPSPCSTCTGENQACINNTCETGVATVVSAVRQWENGRRVWVCTYRYCFSNGAMSTTSWQETHDQACTVGCLQTVDF